MFWSVMLFKGLKCWDSKFPPLTSQLSPRLASASTRACVTFPVEPRFEQAKLGIAKVDHDLLEEENGKYLLFDDSALKELIGDLYQKSKVPFPNDRAAETHSDLAQFCRMPSAGFNSSLKNHSTPSACGAEPPSFRTRRMWAATYAGVIRPLPMDMI